MNRNAPDIDEAKRRAGRRAASFLEDGMTVGLGTGSTTEFAIRDAAERIRAEDLSIRAVPTSFRTERLARELGIPLVTLDEVEFLDVAIDGADEVDPYINLIKGRGGAHTREKVVAALARRFIVLADESKLVDRLGEKAPVPVEVAPIAVHPVSRALERLGGSPELREGGKKDGPVVTDQGLWIIDCKFPGIDDPAALDAEIRSIPGVLEHGLFIGMAHDLLIGSASGVEHRRKSESRIER